MAENLAKWPSKRGPISKIRPSDGCGRDAVPLAVGRWYDFHEFGCHMGNVGSYVDLAQNAYRLEKELGGSASEREMYHLIENYTALALLLAWSVVISTLTGLALLVRPRQG